MHTITPIVVRIGGQIDTFGIGIGMAMFFIHRKPILKAQNTEHGGAIEMTINNVACQPARQRMRSNAFAIEHCIIISL